MSRPELTDAWHASPFTGLFRGSGLLPREAAEPDVPIWSGAMPLPGAGDEPPAGGAGWDEASAEAAGVGEAVERWQAWRLPCDRTVEASFDDWPLAEDAIDPARWVLFHPEQYAAAGFPYRPLDRAAVCRWVCARQAFTGLPIWVPDELMYLALPAGRRPQFCPMVSSGLACGQWGEPMLLRALQETIERDAAVGAAWGRYPLEEHEAARVFAGLDPALPPRLLRPHLRYRFFRIATPFSAHVTLVTLEGEAPEGFCFSVGVACRETRNTSWLKSLLEAVQARRHVRYLRSQLPGRHDKPASFADHAVYYSVHPDQLCKTVLGRPTQPAADVDAGRTESIADLAARLGPDRPVLFRNLTPPGLAMERLGYCVLRVLAPGLQPLHADHALPFLGGPLWSPRGCADWADMPPQPFA